MPYWAVRSQMSALVNLQHLSLSSISPEGVPGGLPSQLVKLTCLHMQYLVSGDGTDQFQHLSSLTALRELSINYTDRGPIVAAEGDLSGIAHLAQLTSLKLQAAGMCLSGASTLTWTRMTALHSLSLAEVDLQPSALVALPQLRALSLRRACLAGDATLEEMLQALGQVSMLTALTCDMNLGDVQMDGRDSPAAAFTALTASTHLCYLEVDLFEYESPADLELFRPGTVYPSLRQLHLHNIDPSQQQLQLLSSCCPALDSLAFELYPSWPREATAHLPLLQLSALTSLQVSAEWQQSYAVEGDVALLGVVAQLTALKSLNLKDLCWGDSTARHWASHLGPALQQLTALTALKSLTLGHAPVPCLQLDNQAGCNDPPDVWMQLSRWLLQQSS